MWPEICCGCPEIRCLAVLVVVLRLLLIFLGHFQAVSPPEHPPIPNWLLSRMLLLLLFRTVIARLLGQPWLPRRWRFNGLLFTKLLSMSNGSTSDAHSRQVFISDLLLKDVSIYIFKSDFPNKIF